MLYNTSTLNILLAEPPLSEPPLSEPSLSEDSELPPLGGGRGERLLLPLATAPSRVTADGAALTPSCGGLEASPSLSADSRLSLYWSGAGKEYVRNIVALNTLREADVDDNLQEVLAHLYLNRHRYDPAQGTLEAWVGRVVRNAMHNINRRPRWAADVIPYDDTPVRTTSSRHGPDDDPADGTPYAEAYDVSASDVLSEPSLSEATEAPSPWGRAGGEASGGEASGGEAVYPRTYQALRTLTPMDRSIIILYADGWPVRDIADELHLPPATVSRRLYIVKAQLREALQHLRRDP